MKVSVPVPAVKSVPAVAESPTWGNASDAVVQSTVTSRPLSAESVTVKLRISPSSARAGATLSVGVGSLSVMVASDRAQSPPGRTTVPSCCLNPTTTGVPGALCSAMKKVSSSSSRASSTSGSSNSRRAVKTAPSAAKSDGWINGLMRKPLVVVG